MKLAITTQGSEMNSPVHLRLDQARFFRIVDTETGQQVTFDKTDGVNDIQGTDTAVDQMLARFGIRTVLTGGIGAKARSAFQAAHIQVVEICGGTVEMAVQSFLDHAFERLSKVEAGRRRP